MQPQIPYGSAARPPLMPVAPAPAGYPGMMPLMPVGGLPAMNGMGMPFPVGAVPLGLPPAALLSAATQRAPPIPQQPHTPMPQQPQQRTTTLYIGNISSNVDNDFMRNLLGVNCNDKVRAEISKVQEERLSSTLRAFKHKTRDEVQREIEEEDNALKAAILELLSSKDAQLPQVEDTANSSTDPKVAPPPKPPEPTAAASNASKSFSSMTGQAPGSAFHRLRKLDPEAIAAAAENSIYRIAPDGTDRRTYIEEDYRPSRRELDRLQRSERRALDFEREFEKREALWRTQEKELAAKNERDIAAEKEISESERQRLIDQDLRGEWWEGLEDPRRRQERKRRRRREAEEDEIDREREQEEQVTQQTSQKPQPEEASDAESDREHSAGGGSSRKKDQKERDRLKDKEKARERGVEKVSREEHKSAVENSQKKVKSPTSSGGGLRTVASSGTSARHVVRDRELRRFFDNGEDDDVPLGEGRKHRPLTKLDEHRDVVNKVNKVKETMEVIEQSKKLLAMVPSDQGELLAYSIDWSLLAKKNIFEKKLRPWVRKKVIEFMGTEEELVQEVIDYILKRVSDRPDPKELLDELTRFLDEEAEGFLTQIWRLLIFEQLNLQKPQHG